VYQIKVPYKNYNNQPKTRTISFNLETREIMKLLEEFYVAFQWQEQAREEEVREYTPAETVVFYNAFEAILLAAYGVVSADGERFEKTGRFEFEESKVFAAVMDIFIQDPARTNELINGILPEGLDKLIKSSEGNMQKMIENPDTPDYIRREVERQLAQSRAAAEGIAPGTEQA